jgi:hypothetical protein
MPHTSLSMRIPLCWLWVILLVAPVTGASAAESFVSKVLRIAGISATPSQLRGPKGVKAGDIWLVNIAQDTPVPLTRDGGYRSPVFTPGNDHILALKGDALVRIPKTGGEPERLHTLKGVMKIVGFDQADQDKALILLEEDGGTAVGLLSLASGQTIRLPYDRTSEEDQSLIIHMQEWTRVYGDTTLYVKGETKRRLAGYTEWTDVYLKRGETPPLNLSKCDGVDCGQPSLSPDGGQVVYIRAEPR